MPAKDVLAAGAVVFRPGKRVLLVHRPRYDDWSFPKGKLDPGEHAAAAAAREVTEETGLHVRLGPPLAPQRYPVAGGRTKHVSYWIGRAVGSDDVSAYRPNDEIDAVEWLPYDEAMDRLSYERDRATLKEAGPRRRRTHAVVVLRHGRARSRQGWGRKDDRRRPLVQPGRAQAERLVPVLAAYDVTRVVTSSSARCVETVAPYADTTGWRLECEDGLSEEDATAGSVLSVVDALVAGDESAVVCTHRPVLPSVFDALGLPDAELDLGAMAVVHLRRDTVVATEVHRID
ncbi:NUDIX hydrolase [Nocardioides sp. YIM 152315]|uniref:NUDIX hydrolase n=1 Tax=Nocardioides sp. YIM 152315 TaxID=3031760 RepID=UPI0023DB3CBF|nr:NUDIX hydrolase [Nocardioides sp. YIM 152315]MDF1605023.1 NUDIX hydrolase [Nocardioides sp. YIM 152315]